MAILHFLLRGRKNPAVAFFDHGTDIAKEEFNVVSSFCKQNKLEFYFGGIKKEKPKNESLEEYWRNERYEFLESFYCQKITGHHLDDVVESWIFGSLNGQPKLIPYRRGEVIRPFLITPKESLLEYAERHSVSYIYDTSNDDMTRNRNYIRKHIVPHALVVNPGIKNMIKRLMVQKYEREKENDGHF